MRTLIFWLVLFLSANGFPIDSNKAKRSSEEKEDKEEKEDNEESLNLTEIARRSCDFGKHFVGSNLFDGKRKSCFSLDDVNLLIARRDFEMMIPRDLPQNLLDDKTVGNIMRYFYYGLWLLRRIDDCQTRRTMEKAFYDTLGGFLGFYLVPVCKFSYYASKVELKTVRNVMALYQKCRSFLNTNGNGWRPPLRDPSSELLNVTIEPLKFDEDSDSCDDDRTFCADLDLATASSGTEIVDDNMIVSLPKIELEDPEGFLTNIWLPFARKRTFNLRSCKSAFIFVKFYRSVSNCYKQKGMEKKAFDHKFRQWIVENIKVHLGDEMFYPGLGGILNVYESLRTCNKRSDVGPTKDNDDLDNALKTNDDQIDYASMIEENSCAFAEQIEGSDLKLRKRAIYDEEMDYLRNFPFNIPMDPEEKKADDWIEAFDESTMHEFQRNKITKTKCKPKCKTFKKKPPASAAGATPSTDLSKLPQVPPECTTSASATKDGTSAPTPTGPQPVPPPPLPADQKSETAGPGKATTAPMPQKDATEKPKAGEKPATTPQLSKTTTPKGEKPSKAEKPTKPPKAEKPINSEKESMSEENKKRLFLCFVSFLFLLLLILLLLAITLCCRKYGKDTVERLKQKIQQLKEKMQSKKDAPPTPGAASSAKGAPAAAASDKGGKAKPADKKADAKEDKKAAKADKKAEKADKKAEKADKKADKKGEKPDKKAEKAAKEAEKAAKKAEKAAKKGEKLGPDKALSKEELKKLGIRPKRMKTMDRSPRPVGGFVSKPTRSRQKRGGRSRSRSPSAK